MSYGRNNQEHCSDGKLLMYVCVLLLLVQSKGLPYSSANPSLFSTALTCFARKLCIQENIGLIRNITTEISIETPYNPGNLSLGQSCVNSSQCTGTENAGTCLDGMCFCEDGFVVHGLRCLPGNRDFGESCEADLQCNKSANVGYCGENHTCSCNKGLIRKQVNCYPGNLSLGQYCMHDIQCTGTKNSGRCLNGECFCGEGFVLQRLKCLPEKKLKIYIIAGGCVIGVIVLSTAIMLALKRRKCCNKSLKTEPMKTNEYSFAEEIDLQCIPRQINADNLYMYHDPMENIYNETHQEEEEESGNIYHRSQPLFPHRAEDIDSDDYSYNHLHERPVEMSKNVYDTIEKVWL